MVRALLVLLLAAGTASSPVLAQDASLLPKYGLLPKNEAQKAADAKFLATIDEHFKGDRKVAAHGAARRGWQLFRDGNAAEAMRRFNQAWLLDANNGDALWGMAVIQGSARKIEESLKLFEEAERFVGDDVDFAVDHARAVGFAAGGSKNEALLKDAFARFARLHERAPQHTLNLQNWAITLFLAGDYAGAWAKVKLAEATPRRDVLDPRFVADLQARMPRP